MTKQAGKNSSSASGRPQQRRRGRPTLREVQSRTDTAEFLVQAASEIMTSKGSVALSLTEIASATGYSPALVQYHFGNKEGLLLALIERDAKALDRLRDLAEEDLPAVIKLRLHIGGFVNAAFRAPYLQQLLKTMQNEGGASARKVNELFTTPVIEFQRKLLEQGQREGAFRPVSPIDFYFIIMGACEQFFNGRQTLSENFGVDSITKDLRVSFARSLTAIILKGIAAD